MISLEDLCIDLLCHQEQSSSHWLVLPCKIAEIYLSASSHVYHRLRRIKCWFKGHHEILGEQWTNEPNFCHDCYIDWPSEKTTLPTLLNGGYCWLVDREWEWFDNLDGWLATHVSKRWWPSWWEY